MENPIDPMLGEWSEDSKTYGTPLIGSPVIDAGNNAYVSGDKDVWGNTRIQNGTVDIGAIEGVPFSMRSGVTYIVTSLEDKIAKDGILTFREAFEAANRNVDIGDAVAGSFSEKDVIKFKDNLAGTFYLGGTELLILGSVDIIGSGTDKLIFNAESLSRVFNISLGIAVGLSNITITNGKASEGGGIYSSGNLTVTNSTITGNSAYSNGGGIYSFGNLTVTNSTITGNSAYSNGGGIYNSSNLTIINSTIKGNTISSNPSYSYSNGGGIYNYGNLTVINSTIKENSGNGIYNASGTCTVTVTDCMISENSGGGIYNNGYFTVINSTISENISDSNEGGGIWNCGTMLLTNCTISGNTATMGGGIWN
jgi:hypothetical protein